MDTASTSEHTPGVNYRATSERFRYEDLPPAVREAADAALGSPVVRAGPPVTSGFTRAYAGQVLLEDGRQAFLKATGPDLPIPVTALRREAQMLTALGDRIPAVPLIGAAEATTRTRRSAPRWPCASTRGTTHGSSSTALQRTVVGTDRHGRLWSAQ